MSRVANLHVLAVVHALAHRAKTLAGHPFKSVLVEMLEVLERGCLHAGEHQASLIALTTLDCLAEEVTWSELHRLLQVNSSSKENI